MSNSFKNDHAKVIESLNLAAKAHKEQRRKGDGNSPYINHLIEVLTLLSLEAGVTDPNILIAAVLHDILEDTDTTENELVERFGPIVLSYVLAVSDDKAMSLEERRAKQLKTMDTAPSPIKYIKLADHCSNISSIPPKWDKQRLSEYITWSHSIAEKCFTVSRPLADIYKQRHKEAVTKLEQS